MSDFSESYEANQSLGRGLSSNKLISACIAIALVVFFGVIYAEKNNLFAGIVPKLRDEIRLPDNYVMTIINQKYPILAKKNDPWIGEKLRFDGDVSTDFDTAALNMCRKVERVVEVGARYGYNSIILGQVVKNSGKYIAIEANSTVAKCLSKNIVLNDVDNVVSVIPKAVSDHTGECTIEEKVISDDNKNFVINKLTVPCDTLDNILENETVSLILINSSSKVFDILKGADNTIKYTKDIKLLVDLNLNKVDKSVNSRGELTRLSNLGLKFYQVVPNEGVKEIYIDDIMTNKKLVILMVKE